MADDFMASLPPSDQFTVDRTKVSYSRSNQVLLQLMAQEAFYRDRNAVTAVRFYNGKKHGGKRMDRFTRDVRDAFAVECTAKGGSLATENGDIHYRTIYGSRTSRGLQAKLRAGVARQRRDGRACLFPYARPKMVSTRRTLAERARCGWQRNMSVNQSVRDGSTTDIVAFWVTKLMAEHKKGWKFNNEAAIYFALISHSAHRLTALHREHGLDTDYYDTVSALLQDLRGKLYGFSPSKSRDELGIAGYSDPEPRVDNPAWHSSPQIAQYWQGDQWRMDFFDTFTRDFWGLKDYAHGADQRKSEFLWPVAEVWIATATSALVHFAHEDRDCWLKVANLVRHLADEIEKDGLRSLPWGKWGRKAEGAR